MKTNPDNINELLHGPDREAHRQVLTELEMSPEPGQAIYFPRGNPYGNKPDFLVALEGHTYFSIYVVTQPHGAEDGKLVVLSGTGGPTTSSPVGHAAAQAVAMGKEIKRNLDYRIFINAVAVFINEGPDNGVQSWGIRHDVSMLFTADRLVERLVQKANELGRRIFHPPHAEEIEKVMTYLNAPGRSVATPASAPVGEMPPEAGITARQVTIQRADVVNVYTTGGAPTIDGL